MKKIIISFIFLVSGIFFVTPSTFAATIQMVGNVSNSDIAPAGSKVIVIDTKSKDNTWTTTVNPDGTYFLRVPEGTYNIFVVPPASSGLLPISQYNQHITSNLTYNIAVPSSKGTKVRQLDSSKTLKLALLVVIMVLILLGMIGYIVWKKKK